MKLGDRGAAVRMELLGRNDQRHDVDAGSDPAVVGILTIRDVSGRIELLRRRIVLLQRKIFDQGHTVDVVEHPHQQQLDYAPDGDNQTAQR